MDTKNKSFYLFNNKKKNKVNIDIKKAKAIYIDEEGNIYDKKSNTKLLSIQRLENQVSNKIALWTGNNSKGDFRKLRIKK